ncbi:MAG: DNA methyltransferase [Chloroflexi bacterium]|nr:DNA methyltransferase [Chloroflexota bacterium]
MNQTVQLGTSPKEDNRLQVHDLAAHDWYRFVLSFPPHLVRDYVERFGLDRRSTVLDPFCGTGTTLVECKKLLIRSVGVEAHPMACFASRTKVNWDPNPGFLVTHADKVATVALTRLGEQRVNSFSDLPLFLHMDDPSVQMRTLSAEERKLLIDNSVSPLPLHKTLVLLDAIYDSRDEQVTNHELLALAKVAVSSASNLRFGPEVGVGPVKLDAPVVEDWLTAIRIMAMDLRKLRPRPNAEAVVHRADSRLLSNVLAPASVDAVITSPPYPNEKDYTRTTRLESVLLGFIRNKQELRAIKHELVRSNTRSVYSSDRDHLAVAHNEAINRIAEDIEKRRIELGKTSGFERLYSRLTKLYFGGMARHLSELRPILRPGASLAYVVGDQASYLRIMIRTGELIADIAESLGYEVVGTDLFRTRAATATKQQLREEVVVLRWPGPSHQRTA